MLHNVLAELVDARGFSTTATTDPTYVPLTLLIHEIKR